jgi:hypothetical protein
MESVIIENLTFYLLNLCNDRGPVLIIHQTTFLLSLNISSSKIKQTTVHVLSLFKLHECALLGAIGLYS